MAHEVVAEASRYQFLPPLSEDEFAALKADIAANGVAVPVVMDESGNVLDGYHRMRAVRELEAAGARVLRFERHIQPGLGEDEKVERALSLNLRRRHMSRDQMRGVGQSLANRDWSNRKIGAALDVSEATVRSWDLERPALDISVAQSCATDMSSGEAGADVASSAGVPSVERVTGADGKSYRARKPRVIAQDEREERRALGILAGLSEEALPDRAVDVKRLDRIAREEHAAEVRAAPVEVPVLAGMDLRHGDFRRVLADLPDESVDIIFTDPPYPQEFLPLWSDLAVLAARVLKPGALLVSYTGQTFLPDVLRRLEEHLRYVWCGTVLTAGPHWQSWNTKVRSGGKPLLFFARGVYRPVEWFEDVYASEAKEKEHHEWQQSVGCARYYLSRLVRPGDVVLDPFLGGGTTAVAARAAGCHMVGAEIDAAALAATVARLLEEPPE